MVALVQFHILFLLEKIDSTISRYASRSYTYIIDHFGAYLIIICMHKRNVLFPNAYPSSDEFFL